MVELIAGEASLPVTLGHRVKTEDGEKTAGELQAAAGSRVVCSNGQAQEVFVCPSSAPASSVKDGVDMVEVVQVSFDPDEPVEAFMPRTSILTMGQSISRGQPSDASSLVGPKSRRGGKGHRGYSRKEQDHQLGLPLVQVRPTEQRDDQFSCPDTHNSWQ